MAGVVEKLLEYMRMSEETSGETKQEDLAEKMKEKDLLKEMGLEDIPEGMSIVEAYLAHKRKMEEETAQKN